VEGFGCLIIGGDDCDMVNFFKFHDFYSFRKPTTSVVGGETDWPSGPKDLLDFRAPSSFILSELTFSF
ncbi:MAG: hypothetical protein WAV63_11615, partial [Trichococcus flocculiformis]